MSVARTIVEALKAGLAFKRDVPNPIVQRLKRSIARPGDRRHSSVPWNAPPGHVVSTVYEIGQRVTTSGNIYACVTAGATGAASPPTGTGLAAITDGTVTWYYVGPSYSSDADAPIYSTSTAQSTLGKCYRHAIGTFTSGAATVVSNDAWYNPLGFYGNTSATGLAQSVKGLNGGIEIETSSLSICIAKRAFSNTGSYGPIIEIDGRYLVDGYLKQINTAGATDYHTITFATRKVRRITVRWPTNQAVTILGVYCDATASIRAPAKTPGALRGMFIGDSFGTGLVYGEGADRGVAAGLFGELGITDWFLDAIAGSGWAAGTTFIDATRLSYFAGYLPDVIFVMTSVNDAAISQATLNAAMTTWLAAVRAAVPNAYIIVLGSMGRATAEVTVEGYVRQFVAAAADAKLIFRPASGDAAGPWFNGTGTVAAPAGTGNGDIYWGADGVHPVMRGQRHAGIIAGHSVAAWVEAL